MNAPVAPAAAAEAARNASPAPPPRRPRRPWRRLILLRVLPLLLLAGAALGGAWYWQVGRFLAETDDAYVQGDIAVLSPRIEADIAAILVADNQPVTAGQVLLRLDDRDARAQLAQAEASLAEAEGAIVTARESLTQTEEQVASASAQIEQARAEQVRAAADARRAEALVGGGWSSRQNADQAVAAQRKADAALRAAEAELVVRRQAIAVQRAQLTQAEARRDQARAALQLARNTLSYTEIRAPFDGIAGNRAAQLGQHVRPGQQLIAVAPPAGALYVTANFKETQLPGMRPGQPAEIRVDAIPGHALHARVDSFAPATGSQFSLLPPENATGNFTKIVQRVPVKLVLEPGQNAEAIARLRPGLSVVAEIDMRADPHAPRGLFSAAAATLGLR
ncbi:HlyD family secretion protein [Pseudoroseomonas cervicalis]|uniref:HlyD family secretion protein n=1 Tax=Teichococcus cervicalis TaxID=204525 RepID=UPI0027827039|nr:HlyD family secretion protein [Pseudoroseomonas cervicalis]MDQ1081303.1 membrane fusion protein (multidrug efflux system) [Pseudoroseomonas cervicalis]